MESVLNFAHIKTNAFVFIVIPAFPTLPRRWNWKLYGDFHMYELRLYLDIHRRS